MPPHRTVHKWMRRIGPWVGILLLLAALIMVWRQRLALGDALSAVRQMPVTDLALHLAVLGATVVGNIICTAIMFNLLMRRFGAVGWLEMQALIASSTLLNYVPLRPGLFGRVAYHRLYNGIAVADSFKSIVQAIGLSAVCVATLACLVMAHQKLRVPLWISVPVPLMVCAAIALMSAMLRRTQNLTPVAIAAATRYLDLLITSIRYQMAFALIGSPIEIEQAAAFACIAVLATMVPFLSNGLGLREWGIGLAAPVLSATQIEHAVTADLLNRAIEIAVIVPGGLLGLVYLGRFRQRASRAPNADGP